MREITPNIFFGELDPPVGSLGALLARHGAAVVVGHPTFGNARTIGPLLAAGIAGAGRSFPDEPVSLVVSDGTWTRESGDRTTLEAALAAARQALDALPEARRRRVQVVLTPYEGYGGDHTPGKGSALKLIFDELGRCDARLLLLFDGDLRNDMAAWQGVYRRVEQDHARRFGERPYFVTARYARHFVDASLTRFIVGPLTTLLGRHVPGGISGDIALSAGAVAHERAGRWTEARRRYGTDISTTFDNIADPEAVIYEIYLGAKLHDITDEAKLSVMPGEVIGAALERLAHWEQARGLVSRWLEPGRRLEPLQVWDEERTGVDFIDPGLTDVFDVDAKIATLERRFDDFAPDMERVLGPARLASLAQERDALARLAGAGDDAPLRFMGLGSEAWLEVLYRAVARLLDGAELEPIKGCLSYLYTAAFLEFVKDRLADLGLHTLGQVRRAQGALGVPADQARRFYDERVDRVADELAMGFFAGRGRILKLRAGEDR